MSREQLKVFTQPTSSDGVAYRTYVCLVCGWTYNEAEGVPSEGIAAGTRWEDLPPNWVCVECGARKEEFELIAA